MSLFPLSHHLGLILSLFLGLSAVALLAPSAWGSSSLIPQGKIGYDDTPMIPGSDWRVHDGKRPAPPVCAVHSCVTTPPPEDATVLFDGKTLKAWRGRKGAAAWKLLSDGSMEVNGTGGIHSELALGDGQLHIEWATPKVVKGQGQGRGNSGVFLMGLYEIQVLDSWQNRTYSDGQAAAIYGQRPPLVNACRKPGEWQSYDIMFRGPRWKNGKLVRAARVTVLHNGVLVQDAVEFLGPTRHRATTDYKKPHAEKAPLHLQDHGNPVRFRNIWWRECP